MKAPISVMVPSCSLMRTYSPTRKVREYISTSPLAACPNRLDPPSVTIRPISSDTPLKASLCAPGRYG